MKIIFAGTPEFAAVSLRALLEASFDIPLVVTQPDRAAGRGMSLIPSEVKRVANQEKLRIYQPIALNNKDAVREISNVRADVMVVVAYGQLVPEEILDNFTNGCINVHASLLPRWRGAAPVQRAIMAGDTETGVCIMKMEKGLDTGPVYGRVKIDLQGRDTGGSLHDKLAELGAKELIRVLTNIGQMPPPIPQPEKGVTYAKKIHKSETKIDWERSAIEIDRLVRAMNPILGARTTLAGKIVKIWEINVSSKSKYGARPGEIIGDANDSIAVACGDGVIEIICAQISGGKKLTGGEFARGQRLEKGVFFD